MTDEVVDRSRSIATPCAFATGATIVISQEVISRRCVGLFGVRRGCFAQCGEYPLACIAGAASVGDTAQSPRVPILVGVDRFVDGWSLRALYLLRPVGCLARGRPCADALVLAMPRVRAFAAATVGFEVATLRAQTRVTRARHGRCPSDNRTAAWTALSNSSSVTGFTRYDTMPGRRLSRGGM